MAAKEGTRIRFAIPITVSIWCMCRSNSRPVPAQAIEARLPATPVPFAPTEADTRWLHPSGKRQYPSMSSLPRAGVYGNGPTMEPGTRSSPKLWRFFCRTMCATTLSIGFCRMASHFTTPPLLKLYPLHSLPHFLAPRSVCVWMGLNRPVCISHASLVLPMSI